jgi:O-antigen/teichoic acid export membrane protein
MILASAFLNPNIRTLAMLAGLAILLEGMTDYLRTSFRMTEHTQFEVVIKATTAIILIGLVIGCIILKRPLTDILLGYITAHFFGLLLSLRLIDRKMTFSIHASFVRHLLGESWPLFLGLICTAAYGQIDLILIKAYRGFAEVGLYQAAYKLLFGFQLLKVVHMAMFPRLAVLYAEGSNGEYRRLMRTSIVVSLIALIPVGVLVMFFPAEIIGLFFGRHYVSASIALPLLIWSGILSFIAGFFTYTLIISGHQKSWLTLEFLALAVLVVIEVALIPRIGFFGAAIATFSGEVVFLILIVTGVYANRKLRSIFF